jgi:hypothetical protein
MKKHFLKGRTELGMVCNIVFENLMVTLQDAEIKLATEALICPRKKCTYA